MTSITQGAVTVGDLTAAIEAADEADLAVIRAEDALWASEVSGHPRRSLVTRRDAALRAAIAAWDTVHDLSIAVER